MEITRNCNAKAALQIVGEVVEVVGVVARIAGQVAGAAPPAALIEGAEKAGIELRTTAVGDRYVLEELRRGVRAYCEAVKGDEFPNESESY